MSEFAAELPSKEDFREAVDTHFQASTPEGVPFELTLTGLEVHVDNDAQENFSLYFRTGDQVAAAQGLLSLRHSSLGEMVLFLVPISQDTEGLQFEAVFNRLKR